MRDFKWEEACQGCCLRGGVLDRLWVVGIYEQAGQLEVEDGWLVLFEVSPSVLSLQSKSVIQPIISSDKTAAVLPK